MFHVDIDLRTLLVAVGIVLALLLGLLAALRGWRPCAKRLAPARVCVQARLTPGTARGLHLTVWGLILVVGLWLFAAVVEDVLTADPMVVVDQMVARWLHAHATLRLTAAMRAISALAAALDCAESQASRAGGVAPLAPWRS